MLFTLILAATLGFSDTTVSTEWLAQNLQNPKVVVLEIGTRADLPHIPGARFVAFDSIVARETWPLNELPSPAALREVFEKAGIGDDARIVVYSDKPLQATRAWFTLDYLGHGSRAAILDGGFAKWQREGLPVETARPAVAPVKFTATPNADRIVTMGRIRPDAVTLIDARPNEQFRGETAGAQIARAGHIPGAGDVPWQINLDANGTLRPVDQLRAIYAKAGVKENEPVVVYCRTGVEATMPYFVLRSLGYDVALYDGSFAEWSKHHATVVATSN